MPRIEFFPDRRSAFVHIPRPSLVDELAEQAIAEGFEEKEEFHVTVLPPGNAKLLNSKQLDQCRIVLEGASIDDVDVRRDTVYRINKPKVVGDTIYPRESIIARVHSGDILRVLGRLPVAYDIYLPTPLLHVTLFTKGDSDIARRGIGIATAAEFNSLGPEHFPPRD